MLAPGRQGPRMRSRCSWSGPERRASAWPWTSRPARWWCRSAGGWTGCRWPSSWPPPGCARCRWPSLHDRLDQRFRLLTGGSRTALERQQTLRATVDWSYSLLTGAEQLLLRRLSVFAESFDLDAAEAVCGFGDLEVLDVAGLLGSLVDKSLVVAEPAGANPALPAAGDHPPVRRRTARRGRRGRGRRRRSGALRALPVCRRDGGRSSDRAGPGQLAGPAGRRPGQPAARRRARGRPPGRDRGGAAPRRRAPALLGESAPGSRRPSSCSCRCCGGPTPAPTPGCSQRRWSPLRPSLNSLTSPRPGSLLNRRSRSPASSATTGC